MLRSQERLEEVRRAGYDSFAASWMSPSAVVRELEMVGEAAGRISSPLRRHHPEVECEKMRRFRSFSKHEYWRIRPELIGNAVIEMPALKGQQAQIPGSSVKLRSLAPGPGPVRSEHMRFVSSGMGPVRRPSGCR